jgi:hypothetical protein
MKKVKIITSPKGLARANTGGGGSSEIIRKKLAEAQKKFREQCESKKVNYFASIFIAREHREYIEDVLDNCSYGNHDYGIDAYYIDKEANLYLYQFKWSEDCNIFKESYERLINKGIERIFGDPPADPKANDLIPKLKRDIRKYKALIKNVYIRFVFDGDVDKAEESELLKDLKEDLESKDYILRKYFGNDEISFIIEYLSNKA